VACIARPAQDQAYEHVRACLHTRMVGTRWPWDVGLCWSLPALCCVGAHTDGKNARCTTPQVARRLVFCAWVLRRSAAQLAMQLVGLCACICGKAVAGAVH